MTAWAEGPKPLIATGLYNHGVYGEAAGIASIGADGHIRFFSPNPIHLITDVDGYFDSSSGFGFKPTATPSRLLDTRDSAFHGSGETKLNVAGVTGPGGVTIPSNAKVLVCNVAAVR